MERGSMERGSMERTVFECDNCANVSDFLVVVAAGCDDDVFEISFLVSKYENIYLLLFK